MGAVCGIAKCAMKQEVIFRSPSWTLVFSCCGGQMISRTDFEEHFDEILEQCQAIYEGLV